jgi:phospholipid-binding lipoprotein MlaA
MQQQSVRRPCRWFALLFATVTLAAGAGCANAPQRDNAVGYEEQQAINDPLEPINRGIFGFNRALDALILKPFAEFYRGLIPPPIQTAVHNFLTNLRSPVVLANDLLQGEAERGGTTLARFIINTTLGVGGLGDPATDFGYKHHDEDFGQTLAVWGVGDGPFLMLPVLGPSNPRDAVGLVVDNMLIDPIAWWVRANPDDRQWVTFSRAGVTAVDTRARRFDEFEDLEKTSLDLYASLRSLYRQFRAAEIANGRPQDSATPWFEDIPDFDEPEGDGRGPSQPSQ